jgi:hypothetical protein
MGQPSPPELSPAKSDISQDPRGANRVLMHRSKAQPAVGTLRSVLAALAAHCTRAIFFPIGLHARTSPQFSSRWPPPAT